MRSNDCSTSVLFHSNVKKEREGEQTILPLTSAVALTTVTQLELAWSINVQRVSPQAIAVSDADDFFSFIMVTNWKCGNTVSKLNYIFMSYSFQLFSICFLSSCGEERRGEENEQNYF